MLSLKIEIILFPSCRKTSKIRRRKIRRRRVRRFWWNFNSADTVCSAAATASFLSHSNNCCSPTTFFPLWQIIIKSIMERLNNTKFLSVDSESHSFSSSSFDLAFSLQCLLILYQNVILQIAEFLSDSRSRPHQLWLFYRVFAILRGRSAAAWKRQCTNCDTAICISLESWWTISFADEFEAVNEITKLSFLFNW